MTNNNRMRTDCSPAASMVGILGDASAGEDPRLATLAHELRDPLNAILMSLDELQPICALEPAAGAARDAAERGSRHMAEIIRDVLERNREVQQRSGPHDVSLGEIVAGAMDIARPLLVAGRHRLAVLLPPDPVPLRGHRARLQQVLSNLLTNAAKFTAPGGQISLIAEMRAGQLEIRVRDTGIGIEPRLLPHIFELYRQGDETGAQGGLGIGLALVKSMVESHGGSVSAHSGGPGMGAEFVVSLPLFRSEWRSDQ